MDMILKISSIRSAFLAWLAGEFRRLSQKQNKLAFHHTWELKTGGATRSSLTISGKKSRYSSLSSFTSLCSTFVSAPTYYRHANRLAIEQRNDTHLKVEMASQPVLHWI